MFLSNTHWPQLTLFSMLFETSICQFNSSKISPITPDEVREHLTRDQRPFLHPDSLQREIYSSIFHCTHGVFFIPVCAKPILRLSSDHRSQFHLQLQSCLTTEYAGVCFWMSEDNFSWNPPEQIYLGCRYFWPWLYIQLNKYVHGVFVCVSVFI